MCLLSHHLPRHLLPNLQRAIGAPSGSYRPRMGRVGRDHRRVVDCGIYYWTSRAVL